MSADCLQEVHDSLTSIEAEAERLYASERGAMDADSQSRDRLYQRAQQVRRRQPRGSGCRGVSPRSVSLANRPNSAVQGPLQEPVVLRAGTVRLSLLTLPAVCTRACACVLLCVLQVATALNTVAGELTYSVDKINELASASLGDPNTPMGSVVRVLNNQLQALGQIEGRIQDLDKQIDGVKAAM